MSGYTGSAATMLHRAITCCPQCGWKMDGASAAELSEAFYRHLLEKHKGERGEPNR